jgi:hypothetical protein
MLFFMDSGGGTSSSWSLNFLESVSAQSIVVRPGSTLYLHTPAIASTTSQGWASMNATSNLVTYVIFTQRVPGRPDQDGTADALAPASRFLVPFDNTSGFVTSVAIVNSTSAAESIAVAFHTSGGATTQGAPINIPAKGHLVFSLPQQFPAETSGRSGLAEFYSAVGAFSVLALRFNPTGAFTAAPFYTERGAPLIITDSGTQALNVSGTWSGSGSDSTGSGLMTWQLTQTGSSVSGMMTASTPVGTVVYNGTFSGTITGSTLIFTINIPVGNISLPSCSATISGSGDVANGSITGTYTGSNSCTGPFMLGGVFTLLKH